LSNYSNNNRSINCGSNSKKSDERVMIRRRPAMN
jgi:hypothetical protein